MTDEQAEEEYRKFITPDEWERRTALVAKGVRNAEMKMNRLNSFKRFKQWEKRDKEFNDK